MPDDPDKPVDLGNAPTTPALEGTIAAPSPGPFAQGSGNPDSTLDMPAAEAAALAENQIAHFRVIRRLGMGGMGVVFACEDTNLARQVAVKLVRDENPAYRARLLREAQAMARLEHPNVVRVYEVGQDRGRMFIAMELVDGETLTSWLRSFRTWQDTVEMFMQVGAGLAAVHGAGLVHRDFKPDNVLVDRRGRARVADFGLARLDAQGGPSPMAQPMTKSGVVMGTPGYMAPEQHFGADVDARADQFAFCIALREALGGRPVDERRWAQVPESVRSIVNRGLSYDVADRFPSLDALLVALRSALAPVGVTDEVRAAHTSSRGRPSARARSRSMVDDGIRKSEPRWIVLLLVLAIVGATAGIVAFVGTRKKPTPPARPPVATIAPADAAVAPPIAPSIDAAVAQVQEPLAPDAAVTMLPPTKTVVRTPRDAGIDAMQQQVVAAAPGQLPVNGNGQGGAPAWGPYSAAWQNAKGGKTDVVRDAVKDVGYDSFDASWKKADLEKTIEGATGAEKAIAQVKLGMVLRRAGDCKAASSQFQAAIKSLKPFDDESEGKWRGRAAVARSLCTLAAGDPRLARAHLMDAINTFPGEIQLVHGISQFEDNADRALAYAHLITAQKQGDASVKAAVKIYLGGYGLSLGP
ncbi:MAG TPA: serine/threonine-protein kinase [Kofleriaceae bacterium]|nr:serine/threonine-protein kinase [Kofleriaceae bacterium]